MIAENAARHRSEYRVGPGASTLLMIFVSLCMATVSILSLVSAMADTRLTERAQMHINTYYAAATAAQLELSEIDGELSDSRAFAFNVEEYREELLAMRDDRIDLIVEESEDDEDLLHLSFSVTMYEGLEIFVLLDVPVSLTGPRYHIVSHVMRNTGDWQPDDTMDLFVVSHLTEGGEFAPMDLMDDEDFGEDAYE